MNDEQQKNLKLLVYWSFSTVLIVFGAITTFITLWVRPFGTTMFEVIKMGFPIWGITAFTAAILVAGYYFYTSRQTAQ